MKQICNEQHIVLLFVKTVARSSGGMVRRIVLPISGDVDGEGASVRTGSCTKGGRWPSC